MAEQLGGGFDAVHAGQPDVHQGDVGLRLAAQVDGVGAALGFAHHAKLGAPLEDASDAIADQLVVVDENNV
jgi:hypothetical protein